MPVSVTKPPYRAEHVGSFPRPERLLRAREECKSGKLTKDELLEVEKECISEIVQMQERVGIGAVTDGEFRKTSWRDFLFEKCDGFGREIVPSGLTFTAFDGTTYRAQGIPKVVGPIRRREPLTAQDFSIVRSMTSRPIKANLPTPSTAHFGAGDAILDRSIYPDRDKFFADLTQVYREEIGDLTARGCRYLQMDEVPLAVICDPKNQEVARARGEDPQRLIDTYIDAINDAIRDRPADMAVCIHLCRGNSGHGMANGGYEPVAERLFQRLDVDGFFLEYDTPRSGDFSPLRHLPKSKRAVLGLVTTKNPSVEEADALKKRIDEAAKHADLDQLCLSPQCGFASSAGPRRGLTDSDVERKLARIVEIANDVWR